MTPDRTTRTMEDAPPSYSAVKVFGPDGQTLIRTISVDALRARKPNRPEHPAPEVFRPKGDPLPSVPALKTLVGPRRKREPV